MNRLNKNIISIVLNNFKNDSRVLKENISLKKAGYNVRVVALHDDGQKEFETIQNIPVHRIKLKSRNWSKNKAIQILKYFEFSYKTIKQYKDIDIFHCNDLNALPIGVIVKKLFNKDVKLIYDAHEYETEINGLRGIQKALLKKLESYLIKYADRAITVSDAIANEYVKLYGISKPALVLNAPPYKDVAKFDKFRKIFGIRPDQKIFLYQGGLSRGRGIEILLDTFKEFWRQQGSDAPVIIFMGYGPLEKEVQNAMAECGNIHFHPAVEPEVLLEYTASADFGISVIEDTCLSYHYCLPNKLFEYLMAELPVIVSNLPEMKRLVEENGLGVVAQENTVKGLSKAIEEILAKDRNDLEKKIRTIKEIYNWEAQEKVLIDVYRGLYAN